MKKKDQDKTENNAKDPIAKFMEGDINAAITLAELTEQLQSLDIKIDRYRGDILSQKEFDDNVRKTAVYMKDNRKVMSKILSDLSKAHNELCKYHIELETTKNDLLQKMKTNFTLNLIAVLVLLTALCVNLIAGERIIPWTDDSIGRKPAATHVQKDTIHLSDKNTTHIRFDSDIKYVDLSNRVLTAKIVDGSKDIVAVKAREPFDFSTSMSCLEADGDMHSFIIVYDENPANLIVDRRNVRPNGVVEDYFAESKDGISAEGSSTQNVNPFDIEDLKYAKQDFYHVGAHRYDIECICKNIFIENDVYYFVFNLKNLSQTSYELSEPRFAVESKSHSSRKLNYEKQLNPKLVSNSGKIDPHYEGYMVYAFDKFTILKDQVFNIYLYEKGGTRNFRIGLDHRDLRQARELNDISALKTITRH